MRSFMKAGKQAHAPWKQQVGPRKVERLGDHSSRDRGHHISESGIATHGRTRQVPVRLSPLTRPWLMAFPRLISSTRVLLLCPNQFISALSRHLSTVTHSSTRPLVHCLASPRIASPSVSTASDHSRFCIMVRIQPNQRLHSNATTLTSDFPSTCHSSPNLLPLSCVSLHHRPLNNPRAFRPSSRPRRRPPRSSRRPALVCSHLALVEFPWSRPDSSLPLGLLQTALRSSRTHATRPPKRSSSSRRTRRRSLLTSKSR